MYRAIVLSHVDPWTPGGTVGQGSHRPRSPRQGHTPYRARTIDVLRAACKFAKKMSLDEILDLTGRYIGVVDGVFFVLCKKNINFFLL